MTSQRSTVAPSAASTDAFELQREVHLPGALEGGRWLTFPSAAAEADFARFNAGSGPLTVVVVTIHLLYALTLAVTAIDAVALALSAAMLVWGLLWLAGVIVFVICGDTKSLRGQTNVARRLSMLNMVSITVVYGIYAAAAPRNTATQCAQRGFGDDSRCRMRSATAVIAVMPAVAFVWRPHLRAAVVIPPIIAAAFFLGALADGRYALLDLVAMLVVAAALTAVLTVEAHGRERAQREQFREQVRLDGARNDEARLKDECRDVLRAALPPQLLSDDDALTALAHRSAAASVAACDIYDFAQWSCGMLVTEVVLQLHVLLTLSAAGARMHDAVCAMTFGDCCVVCAGLIDASGDHEERVAEFAEWLVGAAADVAALPVRVGTCSGPLVGGVAGRASLRYFVAGPALEAAQHALRAGVAGDIIRAEACDAASTSSQVVAKQGNVSTGGAAAAAAEPLHLLEARDEQPDCSPAEFSSCGLAFGDEAVNAEYDVFVAAQEADIGRFTAAVPPALFGAYLVVLGLEHLHADPRRHHSNNGLAVAGLAVAFLLAAAAAGGRAFGLSGRVPYGAFYATTAAALALGCVSLMFTGCTIASVASPTVFSLAMPALFPRLRWYWQVAIVCVTVLLPSYLWVLLLAPPYTTLVEKVTYLQNIPVIFGLHFFYTRVRCRQFAAHRVAGLMVLAAERQGAQQQALLCGLLPRHVLDVAAPAGDAAAPSYMQLWQQLSVVQIALHSSDAAAAVFPALLDLWRDLPDVVAATGAGVLDIVEATGDTLVVAGPLGRGSNDQARLHAAACIVALLGRVADMLPKSVTFTAVATAGSAASSLVGASLLTYRLYGAAVRECHALLAAAPRAPLTVAFASHGFRQQHCNYAALPPPPQDLDAAMSAAVPAAVSPSPPTRSANDGVFGPAALWRVRAVGCVSMARITFSERGAAD
jgi:hypothetical protein